MGIHTGVYQAITTNHSDGRARLPPPVLSAAKAVGDAGALSAYAAVPQCIAVLYAS